jgi:antitoxin component YwqK of YwqJK toxin-antitoxin module
VHSKWFENGQKKFEHTYRNGKLNGPSSIWYSGGQKKESGFYKDGEPHGYFTYWNENGQRREDGSFQGGQKEGLYTYWHDNGQKRQEIFYKGGSRDGKTTVWWPNGQLKKTGLNKDGKPVGGWQFWSESGQLLKGNSKTKKEETVTVKQKEEAIAVKQKEEAIAVKQKEEAIAVKQKDGPYVTFYDNGMIREKGRYLNGKKEGSWRSYNSRGQVLQVETYAAGKITNFKKPGVIKKYATYHDNGRVKAEGIVNNGERDGEWKIYSGKGDLEKIAYFDFGELVVERETDITKEFIAYHDNGRVKAEGKTFYGHRDGKWKFYNENGKLAKTAHYLLGEVVMEENPDDVQEFISYHDNGRLKEKGITHKNIRAGEWKIFNSKGKLSKIILYENGQIIIEKDPDKIEDIVTYHDNGRIKEQGQTYMGHRDGKWKFYNEKGKLARTILYLVGDVIKQDTSL